MTAAAQSQPVYSAIAPPGKVEYQNRETGESEQTKQSPSALYKKCFPAVNNTLTFKERFPVFADILGKYNQNVKKATEKPQTAIKN